MMWNSDSLKQDGPNSVFMLSHGNVRLLKEEQKTPCNFQKLHLSHQLQYCL